MNKYFIILLILLASCSPIKKLGRLEKYHPELFIQKVKIDTVYKPMVQIDTVFKYETFLNKLKDTIFLNKDIIKTKIYLKHDSIYIDIIKQKDTIINKETIKYLEKPAKSDLKIWFYAVLITISLLCIVLIVKKLDK